MSRIRAVQPAEAAGKVKTMLGAVERKLGMVPNMARAMASNPAVLEGYLAFAGALGDGRLGARLGELIALTVAEANACAYCLSAHTAIGGSLKIPAEELDAARDARSGAARTGAALAFARHVVDTRGHVSDAQLAEVRGAGFDDGEIGEIVALAALNTFTNLFNSVAATEVDFPRIAPRLKEAA